MIVRCAAAVAPVVAHLNVPCRDSGAVSEIVARCGRHQSFSFEEKPLEE
jgi:hypothetical protein